MFGISKTIIMAIRQLLTNARIYTLLAYLGAGLFFIVTIFLMGDEIRHHVDAIETWIMNLKPWSGLIFVGFFVLASSLFVPESVLSIMAGALFGFLWGITVVISGNLLAAVVQYGLSQKVLRKRIEQALVSRPSLSAIQEAVRRNELGLQAMLRLTPLNPATISYMLGALGVKFGGFLFACLALVPHLLIEVYFGYTAKHIVRMTARSSHEIYVHDVTIIGGLVVMIFILVFVSRKAHKAVMKAVSETKK